MQIGRRQCSILEWQSPSLADAQARRGEILMPWIVKRPCVHPGCPELSHEPRCEKHRKQERKQRDEYRGSSADRGYGLHWRKIRLAFLASHPLCTLCHAQGYLTAATVVDHIQPHRGNPDLFHDPENLQALCKPCHDGKTASNDGRWSRAAASGGGGGTCGSSERRAD